MSVEPPLFRRQRAVRKIGGAGRKSEKALAHRLGGVQTLASGAVDHDKADIKISRKKWKILLEAKSTQKESMSVKLDWLLKVHQEALESLSTPAFAISFTNDHGVALKHGTWIAVPEDVFNELVEG